METIPEFEYDHAKSRANAAKHGIDFAEAQALWLDDRAFETEPDGLPEPRFLRIGKVEGICWAAVCTWRESRVRLISVRRARSKERLIYDAENDQR